ncbi:MAG: SUMF1/EgtB/PvdO family nonheme iron enzyme, partial [Rudaea sp.]
DRYPDVDAFLNALAAVVPQYAALFREEVVSSENAPPRDAVEATTRSMPRAAPDATTRIPAQRQPADTPALTHAMLQPARSGTTADSATTVSTPILMSKPTPGAGANLLRRGWPILVAILGVALIGYALLTRSGRHAETPESTVTTTAQATPVAPVRVPASNALTALAPSSTVASGVTPSTTPPGSATANDDAQAAADDLNNPANFPGVVDPVAEALRLGRDDLAAQRLTLPANENAFDRFQFALRLDPRNKTAKQGIIDVARKYLDLGQTSLSSGDLAQFDQYLKRADDVIKVVPDDPDLPKAIAAARKSAAAPFIDKARIAAKAWDKSTATDAYNKALQVDPDNAVARDGLKATAQIGMPGFVFADALAGGGSGPSMLIVGTGAAIGRYEITRAQFRQFWNAAGRKVFAGRKMSCRARESIFRSSRDRDWQHPGIDQADNQPVVCVTWPQAAAYAKWLSQSTGKRYRLLAPGEFDRFARRASKDACKANLADSRYNREFGSRDGSACDDGYAATAPIGHYPPVAGLYDIDGNVREWVGACDGGQPAQAGSGCRSFLVKGRGWMSLATKESPTFSDNYSDDVGLDTVGFRVARDLDR